MKDCNYRVSHESSPKLQEGVTMIYFKWEIIFEWDTLYLSNPLMIL